MGSLFRDKFTDRIGPEVVFADKHRQISDWVRNQHLNYQVNAQRKYEKKNDEDCSEAPRKVCDVWVDYIAHELVNEGRIVVGLLHDSYHEVGFVDAAL